MTTTRKHSTDYVCSLDWLQIFCVRPLSWECPKSHFVSPYTDEFGNHCMYRICEPKEYIKGYRTQYLIMYKQYQMATIAFSPTDARVNKLACAIKLANPLLYVRNWRFYLYDIVRSLGWQMLSITRADFCIDFNKFSGGVLPAKWLRRYIQDANTSKASYIRVGSNKFCVYGQKTIDCVNVESVRWGSRESGVSTYMYNKSLELAEKRSKPWIVSAWKDAGLVVNNRRLPVWRIEFSVTNKGLSLLNKDTGEIGILQTCLFDTPEKVREVCQIYASKYFRFRLIPPTGVTRPKYVKDLQEIKLLDFFHATSVKPVTLSRKTDSGRTERMISRRLHALADDLGDYVMLGHSKLTEHIPAIQTAARIYDEVAAQKSFRRAMDIANDIKPTDHVFSDEYVRAIHHYSQRERDEKLIRTSLVDSYITSKPK